MPRTATFSSTIIAAAIALITTSAQAQPFGGPGDFITFSGDVEADFPIGPADFPITILGTDSIIRDVDPPEGADALFPWLDANWRSGIDIKDIRVVVRNRRPDRPRLYVGLNMHGIAGDIDGDGDPDTARDPRAVIDVPWGVLVPTAQSFQIEFDLDNDGIFDLIAQVRPGEPYEALAVRAINGVGADPPGDPVVFRAPQAPPSPDANWPDVEFVIDDFASIPVSGGRPIVPNRVGVQARFSGGDGDDLTEDRLPAFGEILFICARPTPITPEDCNGEDDDCDGRVDEGFRTCGCETGNPGDPELCNGQDDDCDDRIDEGVADCQPCQFRGVGPVDEICDRRDNDCDGAIDEDTEGCACEAGAPGTETCDQSDEDCDGTIDENVIACLPICDPADAMPERCNQRDDDCDGTADEALIGCGCAAGATPLIEECNHLDDDCDGLVDEGLPACNRCVVIDGAMGPGQRAEQCNRLDDDCDGTIDEGLTDCECTCPGGDCSDLYPTAPLAELCNGIDDDCDGLLDEGTPPPTAEDCDRVDNDCDGRIDEGFRTCACEDQGGPSPEVCNQRDDDCDDRIDEGTDCTPCDFPGVRPAPESCDLLDNDCDGRVDEGTTDCICPAEEPRRETACDGTDEDCDGDIDENLAACVLACDPTAAEPEQCNQQDDDCDGNVDEGLPACTCRDGSRPSIELCNRRDDDCDGLLDEGLRNADGSVCDPCALGVAPSEERCNRLDDDCDGIIDEDVIGCECTCPGGNCDDMYLNAPLAELCNGIDDDCDGIFDEDTAGPSPEDCNGFDDDCDGRIDENFRGCGCTEGAPGGPEQCNDGDDDCDGRVDEALDCAPCMFGAAPASEICDLSDNDCDGMIDETLACTCEASATEACDGTDEDCDGTIDEDLASCDPAVCARTGALICDLADADCDGLTDEGLTPCGCADDRRLTGERCNDTDDDCDGLTDEGLPDCSPCTLGVPAGAEICNRRDDDCDGILDEGIDTCRCTCPGGTCGDLYATAPLAERCNEIDDDCDGAVDEDFPEGCDPCVPAPEVCNDLDDDCDGIPDEGACCQPTPEQCNGIDDDCDGIADEDACEECVPMTEICNRLDDDCDGLADEGACTPVCEPGDGGLRPEECNGEDEDCDGRIDEDCLRCPEGRTAVTETCNGTDDDCDGLVDEDFETNCLAPTGSDLGDCSAVGPGGTRWDRTAPVALALFALMALLGARRRRALGIDAHRNSRAGLARRAGPGLGGTGLGLLALAALPRMASAQDVQLFQPQPGVHDYFTLEGTRTVRPFQLVPSLYLSMAGDPLVTRIRQSGDLVEDLDYVSQLTTLDLQAVFGLARGFEIGLDIPIHHTQGTLVEEADDGGFGFGDIRLKAKWAFLPTTADRKIGLGVSLTTTLPTGNSEGYVGEDALTFVPRLILEFAHKAVRAAINAGARFRPEADIDALELRDEFVYGAGLGVAVSDPFEVIAEANGRLPLAEVGEASASSPIEALFGGRYRWESGPAITAGVGTAISADYGSPRWRIFLGLAYMPDPCGPDGDGDGIGDTCDNCPATPNNDQADRDGDGIGDVCDNCPATKNPDQSDRDGDGIGCACDLCPDTADTSEAARSDRDGDGIGDACDLCPDKADTSEAARRDTDGDGIGDACDYCAGKPGGAVDTDGDGFGDECDLCPDIADEQTDIDGDGEGDACDCSISVGQVHFDTSKWDIKGDESFVTLETLAKVLSAYPEIRRLEIQGHTDTMDTNANNITLSKNRAASVRQYLVDSKAITAGRLMACGYGEEQLAVKTGDSVPDARNRRVNFVILELDPKAAGKRKACGWTTVSQTCPDPVGADWVPDAAGNNPATPAEPAPVPGPFEAPR